METLDPLTGSTNIEEDPITGDLFITFPDDIAQAVGMDDWEYVNWDLQPDGTVLLTKAFPPGEDEGDHF
jgi:hypothetical protein